MGAQFSFSTYIIWMFAEVIYLIGLASFYGWLHKEARGFFMDQTRRLFLFGSGAAFCSFVLARVMQEAGSMDFSHEMTAINLTAVTVTLVYVTLENHVLEQAAFSIVIVAIIAWWFVPSQCSALAGIGALEVLLLWWFGPQIKAHWWSYLLANIIVAATFLGPDHVLRDFGWGLVVAQGVQLVVLAAAARGYDSLTHLQAARIKRFAHEAMYDDLTGLQNFRAFSDALQNAFVKYRARGVSFALFTLDIDHFKRINDTYGHLYGNKVLQAVAKQLQHTMTTVGYQSDLYRTGGEEFTILVYDIDDAIEEAEHITRAIQADIRKLAFEVGDGSRHVTVSIGGDRARKSDALGVDVYRRADGYLYHSKQNGRNAITLRGEILSRVDQQAAEAQLD